MCRANYCALLITAILMCAGVAVADEPNEAAQRHYEAGLQEKKDGNMGKALQELNAAIDEAPDFADAYWVRAWVQADLEDNEGACLSFNTFLGLVPDDGRVQQAREAIERLGGTVSPTMSVVEASSERDEVSDDGEAQSANATDDASLGQHSDHRPIDENMAKEAEALVTQVEERLHEHIDYCKGNYSSRGVRGVVGGGCRR